MHGAGRVVGRRGAHCWGALVQGVVAGRGMARRVGRRAANWCMGLCCAGVALGAGADWCMGLCCAGGGAGGEVGRAGLGDGGAPGREGSGDRVAHGAVLGCGDAAVGTRRRQQLRRVLVAVADGERGRQVGLAEEGGGVDPADAAQGGAEAVVGARLGAVAAVDGVGGAHLFAALGRARAGAAAAVHAAAQFAVDRRGAAGAAAAGAGAAAGGEGEVGVAAGFGGGGWRGEQGRRVGGCGGGGSGVWHRWVPVSMSNRYGGGSSPGQQGGPLGG
jgi:hypothetical protein